LEEANMTTLRAALAYLLLAFLVALPALAQPWKLGVSATLTGPNAVNGLGTVNGLNLALDEINAAGGVAGRKVELLVIDDKGTPGDATAAFDQLIKKDNVLMIFGPTLTPQAEQAWVFSNAAKVVSFGTSLTASHLTRIGPYTFRNAVTEDIMTPQSVRGAIAKLGVKRVAAIFQDDDSFAQGAYFAATPAIMKGKATLVAREPFTAKNKDFEARIARIKAKQPDALYISSRSGEAAEIMIEAKKQGLDIPVIGNNNFVSRALYEQAKDAANNVVFTIPWSADFESKRNQDFMVKYEAKYQRKANHFSALGYDALYIVAEALKDVKATDLATARTQLRDALVDVKYEGATGKVKFVRNGSSGYNADKDVFTHIYKDGKFEYWKTSWFGQF
jgi:branched-chain amino acid transport system substrate-binding protein